MKDARKVGLSPRDQLRLTDQELTLNQPERYIVVGYAWPDSARSVELSKGSTKRAVGTDSNPGELLDNGNQALWFVVARVHSEKPAQLHFFVLTEPSGGGLCRPMPIKKEEVFFFHEYRDATTGGSKRAMAWSRNVLVDCVIPAEEASAAPEQESPIEQAMDGDDNVEEAIEEEDDDGTFFEGEEDEEEDIDQD